MIEIAVQAHTVAPGSAPISWIVESAKVIGALAVGYVLASAQASRTRSSEQQVETKALTVSSRHLFDALVRHRREFDTQYEKGNEQATRTYFLNEPVALPTLPLASFVGRGRGALAYDQSLCNSLSDLCDRMDALQKRYDSMRDWALIPEGWPARLGPYQVVLYKAHDTMRTVLTGLRRYSASDTRAEIDRILKMGN
jgi:hypothetical protein